MWVKSLSLHEFRNYSSVELEFQKGINYIQGLNGSGKTSLVEAIGLLSMCKSIRSNDEKEIIRFNSTSVVVKASLINQIQRDFKIVISQDGKYIELDGNEVKKVSEIAGIAKVISFIPKDVELFKDIPAKRRRFLDLNLSMLDKVYLKLLGEYNRYLVEVRNLIKQDKVDFLTLDVLLKEMAKRGIVLQNKRECFISELNKNLSIISRYFTEDKILMKLNYLPNVICKNIDDYFIQIRDKIVDSLNGKNRIVISGVHLDDFSLDYNSQDLALYGSQGQNRLSVICLKLSLFRMIKEQFNEEPIVILDDVLSELDINHQNKLMKLLNQIEQVFITGTKFDLKQEVSLFNVEDNLVRRVN